MHIFIQEIRVGTALANGDIWDEYSEKHQHQSTIFYTQFALLLVQI